jgi:hypothetical protein
MGGARLRAVNRMNWHAAEVRFRVPNKRFEQSARSGIVMKALSACSSANALDRIE